ncbi:hypothetical protein AAG906_011954 [Vitis piasezkii]
MEGDIRSLITVCLSVLASLCYAYFIVSKIPKGKLRLLSLLPIFSIFVTLPSLFSSILLSGFTALFISWLATFKLALLSFDLGPLVTGRPKSLPIFIIIACLPIKIKQNQQHPYKPPKLPLNFAVKILGFGLFIGLDCFQSLQLTGEVHGGAGGGAAVRRAVFVDFPARLLGTEVEPHGGQQTVVATAGGGGDVCGIRFGARVVVLLHWSQVTVFRPVAAALGCFGAAHCGVRGGYQLLAVFSATDKSRGHRPSRWRN